MPNTVLIVEPLPDLGALWANAIARLGATAFVVADEDDAIAHLHANAADVILADLDLPGAGAMAVADYAAYRHPAARVIFITASSFFSDGSIFAHSPNACAFLPAQTSPEDIAAVVDFQGKRRHSSTG